MKYFQSLGCLSIAFHGLSLPGYVCSAITKQSLWFHARGLKSEIHISRVDWHAVFMQRNSRRSFFCYEYLFYVGENVICMLFVRMSPGPRSLCRCSRISFLDFKSDLLDREKNKYVCSAGSCRGSRVEPVLFNVTVRHLDDWSESWRHWLLPSVNTSVSCKPRSVGCHGNANWQPWIKARIAFDCICASTTMSNVTGQQLLDRVN